MTIRTRFAPSPTGYLHIGGVRTALFCWLYARHHDGQFLLRIEDTDRVRSTQASIDAIFDGMSWLGLRSDEPPVYQSRRSERYREVVDGMLQSGLAYRCDCSQEDLEKMRAEQKARGENPRYDGRCRNRTDIPQDSGAVVRFRNPDAGPVVVEDLIHGTVEFDNAALDDLIIVRSDGTPTYQFAVIIDDADMGITHVIRGDDHLNNTPRQVNMIEALGFERPVYAHLPMILGHDGSRLSKRHGAVNVLEYRDQGYLPEAMLNYLARLGWSHGDQELFSIDELVELFDLADVNASAARFDTEKLGWINQQYIMSLPAARLETELATQYARLGIDTADGPPLADVVDVFRERAVTMGEMAASSSYVYMDFSEIDPKAAKKHLRPVAGNALRAVRDALAGLGEWQRGELHAVIQGVAERTGLGFGKIGQPLRVAVTGGAVSPPIDATLELVGKVRVLRRLDKALEYIAEREKAAGPG